MITLTVEQVSAQVKACRRCSLGTGTIERVPGHGNEKAEIVFVGEAPGEEEAMKRIPFVGRSGKRLMAEFNAVGIDRDSVFITNVCRCRPPGNRQPHKPEISACSGFLFRELESIRPKVVVALGLVAAKLLYPGRLGTLGAIRGEPFRLLVSPEFQTTGLITYHPSKLLRPHDPSEDKMFRRDLKLAVELCSK